MIQEPTEKQLSGLGFNATVRDELIVRLGGSHKRVVKIKFQVMGYYINDPKLVK